MKRSFTTLAALLLLLAFIAGCAPAATTTTPAATSTPTTATATTGPVVTTICRSLGTVDGWLNSLANIGGNTTVGDVKATQQKITAALTVLAPIIPSDYSSQFNQLQTANNQLASELANYPDSATLNETNLNLTDFKSQVANAQTSAKNLESRLNCP